MNSGAVIVVADTGNQKIRLSDGNIVAGNGEQGDTVAGNAVGSPLFNPKFMLLMPDTSIWFSDDSNVIKRIYTTGTNFKLLINRLRISNMYIKCSWHVHCTRRTNSYI